MMRFPFTIALFIVFFLPVTASAELTKAERDELFGRIDHMCKDASSIGSVLKYEGSLDAGATLKIVGIDASGKVNREQWSHIEQKYGEIRTIPTICNFEMYKLILPLFGSTEELPATFIANVIASSGQHYVLVENALQDGSRVYTDRAFIFSGIPDFLLNATHIETSNNDKGRREENFLTFVINRLSEVYVAYDTRYRSIPDWMKSYQNTGREIIAVSGSISFAMRLYMKVFHPGPVILGGNFPPNETGNYGMYAVIIREAGKS